MRTKVPKRTIGSGKELDAFTAGWNAVMDSEYHDWGPAPPSTPAGAKKRWLNTCNYGHVIRVTGCPECAKF